MYAGEWLPTNARDSDYTGQLLQAVSPQVYEESAPQALPLWDCSLMRSIRLFDQADSWGEDIFFNLLESDAW